MAQVSPLAVVESTTRRLKARLQQLDSIGLCPTVNRTADEHGRGLLSSFASSIPYPSRAPPQEPFSGSAKQQITPRTATPQPAATRGVHRDPTADPIKALPHNRQGSSEERAQTHDRATSAAVRPTENSDAHHERLVQSVMRDFGFDFTTARRLGKNEHHHHHQQEQQQQQQQLQYENTSSVVATNHSTQSTAHAAANATGNAGPWEVPEATHCCARDADAPTSVRGNDEHNSSMHHPRLGDTILQDVSSVGGVNDLPTTIVMEDDELPRPRTPPRPHRATQHQQHQHAIAERDIVDSRGPQRPDVLVVAGFDDPSNAVGHGTTESTSFEPRQPVDRSTTSRHRGSKSEDDAAAIAAKKLCASPLGPPTFSSAAIADLLATTRANLTAAKRDELFAVAQRAYEGIVGTKGVTSTLYRTYPNVCRASERSLPPGAMATSLKSADDVFGSIVAHTTMQHRMGTTISDQRAIHRSLVVPGGCSTGAAEAIAKRLGRMGQVLRVVPAAAAARSSSARRAASRSPPRWPRRVVSTPFVTDSLSTLDKQVRHVSAPRRAQHPSAVRASGTMLRSGTQPPPPRRSSASPRQ